MGTFGEMPNDGKVVVMIALDGGGGGQGCCMWVLSRHGRERICKGAVQLVLRFHTTGLLNMGRSEPIKEALDND